LVHFWNYWYSISSCLFSCLALPLSSFVFVFKCRSRKWLKDFLTIFVCFHTRTWSWVSAWVEKILMALVGYEPIGHCCSYLANELDRGLLLELWEALFPNGQHRLVRLAGSQLASSAFLSHQFSTSQQPPASQQYFSLTTNQHQPPATSQPNNMVRAGGTRF
jgi:hypothetical protein